MSPRPRKPPVTDWAAHFRAISDAGRKGKALPRARVAVAQATASFGGSVNPSASDLQAKLNALGASPQLVVDGSVGSATIAAIKAFQSTHGLVPDGVPGPQTLAALGFTGATSVAYVAGGQANPSQKVLPANNTPLSPQDAAKALSQGYQKITGSVPSKDVLSLMMGQTALETGNWQKMPNYNFGGTKAQASDPYVQTFKTQEVIGGVTQTLDQTFGAYTSAAEGAAAYVRTVLSRPNWAQGLHSGTPEGFVTGLTTPPVYFTASPSSYLSGLKDRTRAYLALAEQYAVPISTGLAMVWLAFGAAGLGVYALHRGGYL